MANLSVIIITKNEESNIRQCLESVKWADEIVVVDSGSTDATVAICREYTQKVFTHDWPGFGLQKNRALDYATNEWVLSLDADERVEPDLHAEIERAISTAHCAGYFIPRLSQFCGKFIHHSGWYPDYVLRLFRRNAGKFSDSLVHEKVILEGNTGRLKTPLLHYSYTSKDDVERKIAHYSTAAAEQMYQAGKHVSFLSAYIRGGWAFVRTYVLRKGMLDGVAGWQIASMNARTTYLKYNKLRMLRSSR